MYDLVSHENVQRRKVRIRCVSELHFDFNPLLLKAEVAYSMVPLEDSTMSIDTKLFIVGQEATKMKIKAEFKGKILPSIHHDSIRVRLIVKGIIEALQRGLKREQAWSDIDYASGYRGPFEQAGYGTLMAFRKVEWDIENGRHSDDEWTKREQKEEGAA
ncbi:hypothetical protein Nepgr_020262 [Nepenthes gracilis]|uniref:Uncharacterized protein n=1 Tax=Nepenthes gracilis TaxID=150966 RepID=A0AAD3XW67_NEPGR|nr:hypothetical protein Nepgr_020262 [Nepenthes gracilis]